MLLEDQTLVKFTEDVHQNELKITAVKEYMKKLPIKENIAKVVELKKLQKQVKTLRKKEQHRNEEVTTQQTEAE